MSKPRVPSYRHHRPSGLAVVTLNGRDRYLGIWNTEASRQEYERLIGEWLANGRRLPNQDVKDDLRSAARSPYRLLVVSRRLQPCEAPRAPAIIPTCRIVGRRGSCRPVFQPQRNPRASSTRSQ
jgi:hypothetical protein